ncbi:MAG: efflux RND transporter periplasmic adaptor subunit [Limisphaerales bacterium]
MAENEQQTGSGNRAAVVTVLVILLLVVTVVVLQMIQRAETAGGPGGMPPGGEMPPAAVIVKTITKEKTQERAIVTGTLRAVAKTDVAAREAGAVEKVFVDEGAEVKAGDSLALLDVRRINLQISEATAALTSATNLLSQREAELKRAETDHSMKQGLFARKAVAQADVLDAEKTLKSAMSLYQSAQAGIRESASRAELLQVKLEDLTVRTPVAGVVVDRKVEPGEWLASGAVVASIVTVDPVEAWLRVPARFLDGAGELPDGFQVRRSSTGKAFQPSTVTRIPEVDGRSQLFTVVATIPNTSRALVPGESVTGVVPIGAAKEYWRIPKNAIVHSPQGTMIYRVDSSVDPPVGQAVPVVIGFERDGFAFVATGNGIQDGDRLVVEGNQRLRPGQGLMIKPVEGAAPPTP